MKIVWDEPKRRATLFARGLDFSMVTPEFFQDARIRAAKKSRFLGLGLIDGRPYAVVFKVLGSEAISIVSLRRASAKEKRSL